MSDWQDKLKIFLQSSALPKGSKVYLFGSRARGDNSELADIDLAFENIQDFNIKSLDEEIDKLNIVFNIDLVNLNEVNPSFYNKAKNEGVLFFEKRS